MDATMRPVPVRAEDKRYLSVKGDPAFRLALKAVASSHGMSVSGYLERLIRDANPDFEALLKKFERA